MGHPFVPPSPSYVLFDWNQGFAELAAFVEGETSLTDFVCSQDVLSIFAGISEFYISYAVRTTPYTHRSGKC